MSRLGKIFLHTVREIFLQAYFMGDELFIEQNQMLNPVETECPKVFPQTAPGN
jgi:hypothetical protein